MRNKKFTLKNCAGDICKLSIDLDDIKYIFKQVISGDEIFIVVDKNNKVKEYDSDMHCRCMTFNEGLEMIYPQKIDLFSSEEFEPDSVKEFVFIKEGNKQ